MTYELGRAQFILQADGDDLLKETSKTYNEVTKGAQKLTKELAKELKVRQSDVKSAASVIISEEKKLAAEQAKIAKAQANDRKKTTQELLRINEHAYKEEQKQARDRIATLKRLDKERDDAAKKQLRRIQQEIDAENKKNKAIVAVRPGQAPLPDRRTARTPSTSQGGFFGGSVRGLGGDLATIAGFGAIASGAIIVREALITLVDATRKQEAAQRGMNAAFGQSQILFKQNTTDLAKQFNLVDSEVQQATARFGVLANQTVLTGEQIRKLNQVAIDNQAAFGGDLLEAHRSLAGAILGETEAYEKYGVVLQEGVLKSSQLLTEDERKRFTTMSESEKQMIRYRIILEEATKVQGAAAKQAQETQGGFNLLNRSVDELAKTLGATLVPEFGKAAGGLGNLVLAVDAFLRKKAEFDKAISATQREGGNWYEREVEGRFGIFAPRLPDYLRSGSRGLMDPRGHIRDEVERKRAEDARRDANDRELAQIVEHTQNVEKARQAARDKSEADAKAAQVRLEATLQDAHDREIRRIDEAKQAAEFERQNRLDALEETHEAQIENLRQTEEARKRASELELARIQAEKDAAIQASQDRRDAELERIEREKEAVHAATEDRIRQWEIERDARKRANDALRDSTLQSLEDTRDQELERLEAAQEERERLRELEDREIADSIEARQRREDSAHKKTLQRLEREGEELRRASTKRMRAIEDREEKEDDRHNNRLVQIDAERDAALEAIDKELDALEAAERRRDQLRRRRGLNQQLSEAQLQLRQATGTQDPAARVAAQQKLIGAIRIGDPTAIKKAQDELAEIVGQGLEAVAEAQQNLSNIQEDLRDEDIKQTEDAQREKLEAEKERIQNEKDLEKDHETQRDTNRKARLEKDKRAEQDRLDDALRKLERRVERENDEFQESKQRIDDLTKFNSRQLEDRRREEDLAHERAVEGARKTYEAQTDLVRQRYEAEQENIRSTYDDEATGYIPAIRRALKESDTNYELQAEAATKRYKAEQLEITNTYDNPQTGLIAVHRRMEQDAAAAYQAVVRTVQTEYENARQAVERAYVAGDGKSGIIDKLDVLKQATEDKLAEVLESFKRHKDGLVGDQGVVKVQWEEALEQAKRYFDFLDAELKKKRTSAPLSTPTRQNINPGGGNPQDVNIDGSSSGGDSAAPPMQEPPVSHEPVKDPNNFGKFVLAAGSGSYWTDQGTHNVPGAVDNKGAADVFAPIGTPIYAAVAGRIRKLTDVSGGNAAILSGDNGYYYYLAHGNVPFASGTVKQGQQIGEVGDTGSARGTSPHLHFAIATDPSVFDRLRGKGNIAGSSAYWSVRDNGYLFNNPTMYQDMRTGEKGVLAERGPERLLGRKDTRVFDSSGLRQQLTQSPVAARNPLDYSMLGSSLLNMPNTTSISHGGDTMVYQGVAPENLIKQWRADQRKQRVLRGVRKIG